MRWGLLVGAGVLLLGGSCRQEPVEPDGRDTSSPPTPTPTLPTSTACGQDEQLTWDGFAEGFFLSWCTACHSSQLGPGDRGGAPVGIDFDLYRGVLALSGRIVATATGPEPTMPPVASVPVADRERLAQWIACGLPEAPVETEPACELPLLEGDLVLASSDEVEAFCEGASGVTGSLTLQVAGTIDCLCSVAGDLEVRTEAGAELDLPHLDVVGGALRLTDNPALQEVQAPVLRSVGSVSLARNPSLAGLVLPALSVVSDPAGITVDDDGLGGRLSLDQVEEVAGLRLVGLPRLEAFSATGLVAVTGNIEIADVGAESLGFDALATLQGSLEVSDAAQLVSVAGLRRLVQLDGSLRLSNLPALEEFDGLYDLENITGDVVLDGLGALEELGAFGHIKRIEGDLEMAGMGAGPLTAWPSLRVVSQLRLASNTWRSILALGVSGLEPTSIRLEHHEHLERTAALGWGPNIPGDVVICDNAALVGLDLLTDVVRIDGDLELCRNASLRDLTAAASLRQIHGDVVVQENPELSLRDVEAWLDLVEVEGTVTLLP